MNALAWLYWNPNREIFTIPYIDRPIVWYGVFFAVGFWIGYYILLLLCRRYFDKEPFLVMHDIASWSRFLMTLKNKKESPFLHRFLHSLPNPLKEKVLEWNLSKEIDEGLQKGLLFGLNHFIEQGKEGEGKKAVRLFLEALFPCCMERLNTKVRFFVDKLALYTVIATVIGARLGHILFYESIHEYLFHPLRILKTWEGGLASHGAVIGIVIGFAIFYIRYHKKYPQFTVPKVCDFFMLPAMLSACFIRIGNFFNQEILGKNSQLPWAIIFGNPADGSVVVPRHPAQLYEACGYFLLFILVWRYRKASVLQIPGRLSGLTLTVLFSFRFFVELIKEEQSFYHIPWITMGQALSIPMIIFGVFLWYSEGLLQKVSKERLIDF